MSGSSGREKVMKTFKIDIILTACGSALLVMILIIGLFKGAGIVNVSDKMLVNVVVKADIQKANKVGIAGSFNEWREQCCFRKDRVSGLWLMELKLHPGIYEYVLIVDGVARENNSGVRDGLGGNNQMLFVNDVPLRQGDDNA